MSNWSGLSWWPVCRLCACIREGSLRCSLYHSPRVLEVSPIYSSPQSMIPHWLQYMTPLFFSFGSWSLGFTNTCLSVLLPLKCVCIPYLAHTFLMLSPQPLNIWDDYVCYIGSSPGGSIFSAATWVVVCLCDVVTNLGVVTISLSVVVCRFVLYFINGPPWVTAPYQSLTEVL